MAMQLPSRPSGRARNRDPGVVGTRLPTAANVPQVRETRDPGLFVPNTGAPIAQGLAAIGGALTEADDRARLADLKILRRTDAVERARDKGSFDEQANAESRRIEAEDDISKEATLKEYGAFLDAKRDEILNSHAGSPESRLRLQESLEEKLSAFKDSAAAQSVAAGRSLVNGAVTSTIKTFAKRAGQSPGSLTDLFILYDREIADVAPGLSEEGERKAIIRGRSEMAKSAISSHLDRGSIEGAQDVFDTPGLAEVLGAAETRKLRSRITAARRERDKPREAASPAGKIVQDRELFIRQFGEDSEQVAAFDEATDPDQEDKPASLSDIGGIRREFTKASGVFVSVRDSFNRVTAAAHDPSPAGDLALIFNYMKILDPGSVVRESEFAQAAATGSFTQRIQAAAARLIQGERLSDDMRADFVSRAQDLMQAQLRAQLFLEGQYRGIADRAGIDSKDVVVDFVGEFRSATQGGGGGTVAPQTKPRIELNLDGTVAGGGE